MPYLIVGTIVMALCAAWYSSRKRVLLTPLSVFTVAWLTTMWGAALLDPFRPAPEMLTLLVAAGITLQMGVLVGDLIPSTTGSSRGARLPRRYPETRSAILIAGLFATTLFGGAVRYAAAAQIFPHAGIVEALSGLRISHISGAYDLPWWLELGTQAFVVYIPLALLRLRTDRWRTLLVAGGLLLFTGMSLLVLFRRAPLIELAVVSICSWQLVRRGSRMRDTAMAGGLIILGIAAFLAIQLSVAASAAEAVESLKVYAFGSPRAFEVLITGGYVRSPGYIYTLDSMHFFAEKFGFTGHYLGPVRAYADLGSYITNVYTFLDAYALDFGVPGVFLGSLLTGVWMGWIARYALIRKSVFGMALYSFTVYSALMSPLNNEFIRPTVLLIAAMAGLVELLARVTIRGNTRDFVRNVEGERVQ